jgi:hypothetical protein
VCRQGAIIGDGKEDSALGPVARDDLRAFGIGLFDQLAEFGLCLLNLPDGHMSLIPLQP